MARLLALCIVMTSCVVSHPTSSYSKWAFAVAIGDLHKVRALLALLEGEPVYRAQEFAWPQ
jgi:hypothetical protein